MAYRVNLRGVSLELHPEPDYMTTVIAQTGDFFEATILDEIRRRVTGGVLVDAGAMIGNHTAYLAEFVSHSAIHAFEPVPVNLELLRRNVASYPTVQVHPIALSDAVGRLTMAVQPDNFGHAVATLTDPYPRNDPIIEVEARTLDSYGFTDVSLLKLDVEWHETQVLAGARETIARCHPLIVIEDWEHAYGALLPDYRVVMEWPEEQTFLYEPS